MKLYASIDQQGVDALLCQIGEAVAVGDGQMRFVAANLPFARFYGLSCPSELLGKSAFDVYPEFEKSVFYDAARHTLANSAETCRIGYSANLKTWIAVRCYPLGQDRAAMVVHKVTSDLAKSGYVNQVDALTSLPNRWAFEADYESLRSYQSTMSVALIDVSHFKKFNETAGFHAGDRVLMEIAARLKRVVAVGDRVYRIGNDQFLVLSTNSGPGNAALLGQMHKSLLEPFCLEGREIAFRFHFGSTITTIELASDEVLRQVEVAMFHAKRGRGLVVPYDPSMESRDYDQALVKEITDAISSDQLRIVLQPQVDLTDDKVVGAEVLVRWHHPSGAMRPPLSFLPFAEETGMIEEIDREVIRQSFRAVKDLQRQGVNIPLSVNLSAHSVCRRETLDLFAAQLKESGINPSSICVEITETSLIRDIETSQVVTQGLKDMGLKISIDDFGSGYSSMSYLLRYPSQFLKIDGEFIRQITTSEAHHIMVRNMVGLAHGLGIGVVAEGVETREERDLLRLMGCDLVQGYFYARPMPLEDFISWVKSKGVGDYHAVVF